MLFAKHILRKVSLMMDHIIDSVSTLSLQKYWTGIIIIILIFIFYIFWFVGNKPTY